MNNIFQYTFFSQVLAFMSLLFCLIAVVAGLNCLWRAHKMLATFIKLFLISVAILALRKIFGVLGYNQLPNWVAIGQYFDLAQSFFFMLAAIELYKISRHLDGEEPKGKK
jgi:hypothetical protein